MSYYPKPMLPRCPALKSNETNLESNPFTTIQLACFATSDDYRNDYATIKTDPVEERLPKKDPFSEECKVPLPYEIADEYG